MEDCARRHTPGGVITASWSTPHHSNTPALIGYTDPLSVLHCQVQSGSCLRHRQLPQLPHPPIDAGDLQAAATTTPKTNQPYDANCLTTRLLRAPATAIVRPPSISWSTKRSADRNLLPQMLSSRFARASALRNAIAARRLPLFQTRTFFPRYDQKVDELFPDSDYPSLTEEEDPGMVREHSMWRLEGGREQG